MHEVRVIADPAAAIVALDPIRARLLHELASPISASGLAARVGLSRQKANYHLRALEQHALVHVVEERQWGGLTERLLVADASSYVVSPAALGPVATDPGRHRDRLSAGYLIALAARAVREVGALVQRAQKAQRRLATLSLDSEVRFRSASERAAFTHDLTEAVTNLIARYHDEHAPSGRTYRLVLVAHPSPGSEEAPCP